MDGENNGSNPMNKWMIWGVLPPIFGNTYIPMKKSNKTTQGTNKNSQKEVFFFNPKVFLHGFLGIFLKRTEKKHFSPPQLVGYSTFTFVAPRNARSIARIGKWWSSRLHIECSQWLGVTITTRMDPKQCVGLQNPNLSAFTWRIIPGLVVSNPYLKVMKRPFGRGPTTWSLGDLRSPWLLSTY